MYSELRRAAGTGGLPIGVRHIEAILRMTGAMEARALSEAGLVRTSSVNIRRAEALIANGRMQPAGRGAFEARREHQSGIYSYEQRPAEMPVAYRRILMKRKAAWRFFQAQSPSYRKTVAWWIVSAKKEETRLRRLEQLAEPAAQGQRLPGLTPRKTARPKER